MSKETYERVREGLASFVLTVLEKAERGEATPEELSALPRVAYVVMTS